jgi:hypothetical protein
MVEPALLPDLSRQYCVAICALLVPANLLATAQVLAMTAFQVPTWQRYVGAVAGLFYATLMVLHVMTWLTIGVVMVQTFVLLCLGSICLAVHIWAMASPSHLRGVLQTLYSWVTQQVSVLSTTARL